jgi:hypothetical protein
LRDHLMNHPAVNEVTFVRPGELSVRLDPALSTSANRQLILETVRNWVAVDKGISDK